MASMDYDVIVFGTPCCDIIYSDLPGLPRRGQEVLAGGLTITAGGSFTVAAAAARLGLHAGLPCVLGTDLISQYLLQAAQAERVDPGLIFHVDGPYEQLSTVLNFGSERSFISYSASQMQAAYQAHLMQVGASCKAKTAVLGMSGDTLGAELARAMRAGGSLVVLDAAGDETVLASGALKKQIALCDFFVPNLLEAQQITGHTDAGAAAKALAELCPNVIVKTGPKGAIYCGGGDVQSFAAPDFGPVVDTTGAGDNFVAGLCYGLVKGAPVEQCIRYGLICGSRSVLGVGGVACSASEDELLRLA